MVEVVLMRGGQLVDIFRRESIEFPDVLDRFSSSN